MSQYLKQLFLFSWILLNMYVHTKGQSKIGFYDLFPVVKLNIEDQDYSEAVQLLTANTHLLEGKHRFVYYLEMGSLYHFLGEYEESNRWFEQADLYVENYMKNIGDITVSYLSNPNSLAYPGKDFENIFINYYKALNFIQLEKFEDALVEVKRMNILLNQYNDVFPENSYKEDAYIHLIMGIVYDINHEYNDACIAYKNAFNIYNKVYSNKFNVSVPRQLILDIARSAKKAGLVNDHLEFSSKLTESELSDISKQSSVLFIWHNGLVPEKREEIIEFTVVNTGGTIVFNDNSDNEEYKFAGTALKSMAVLNSIINDESGIYKMSFANLKPRESSFNKGSILDISEQRVYNFQMCEDLTKIAIQSHKDRKTRDFSNALIRLVIREAGKSTAKAAAKAATKEGIKQLGGSGQIGEIAGVVTSLLIDAAANKIERSDLRQWSSLPGEIMYCRVYSDPGDHQYIFRTNGLIQDSVYISLNPNSDIIKILASPLTSSSIRNSFIKKTVYSEDFTEHNDVWTEEIAGIGKFSIEEERFHMDVKKYDYDGRWIPFEIDFASIDNFSLEVDFEVIKSYGNWGSLWILWNFYSKDETLKKGWYNAMIENHSYLVKNDASYFGRLKKRNRQPRKNDFGFEDVESEIISLEIRKINEKYYIIYNGSVKQVFFSDYIKSGNRNIAVMTMKSHIAIDRIQFSELTKPDK